ncbi:hypothetical protein [Aquimarina brevivitae]|uniref:Uncharacterized protein n=1 Tax=Aquimarina brevivitae TaxID=323412 RepID=A0A4V2F578_9FLAO|nr:hypothetical protein [Aquimarina brevivitae]RZS91869.1 hypothetical protein EV197_2972 [Aquimarina brevivitae]
MQKITFLLLVIGCINWAVAECTESGMQFYPTQKEISLNPMFIIQGYAESQKTVNSFENRKVYLVSETGDRIQLRLQEMFKGQFQLTQAIFYTTSSLEPNTTYFLTYENQTEAETIEMIKYYDNKEEKVYWTTSDQHHVDPLTNSLSIAFEKTEVFQYGCGPEAYASFAITNKPKAEIWYKTEVKEVGATTTSLYYITPWFEKLHVGHDMCSGAFTFTPTATYKVRFTPMNIDGKSLPTTDWIAFTSPFMKDELTKQN